MICRRAVDEGHLGKETAIVGVGTGGAVEGHCCGRWVCRDYGGFDGLRVEDVERYGDD